MRRYIFPCERLTDPCQRITGKCNKIATETSEIPVSVAFFVRKCIGPERKLSANDYSPKTAI